MYLMAARKGQRLSFAWWMGNLLNCSVPAVSRISSITWRPCRGQHRGMDASKMTNINIDSFAV
jgi:hypothetical protein